MSRWIQPFYRGSDHGFGSPWRNAEGTWCNSAGMSGRLNRDPVAAAIPGMNTPGRPLIRDVALPDQSTPAARVEGRVDHSPTLGGRRSPARREARQTGPDRTGEHE
jgi:hypothetical protein